MKTNTKGIFKIARARKVEDGKFGYIDQDYQIVVDFEYDYVYDFINGFGVVKLGDKFGVVDHTGNIIKALQHVEPRNMEIANDEYTIFRDPNWHIGMARTLLNNYYSVRYDMKKNKFVIFPEEFYERNVPISDHPNFAVYRNQHDFFSVGVFMGITRKNRVSEMVALLENEN